MLNRATTKESTPKHEHSLWSTLYFILDRLTGTSTTTVSCIYAEISVVPMPRNLTIYWLVSVGDNYIRIYIGTHCSELDCCFSISVTEDFCGDFEDWVSQKKISTPHTLCVMIFESMWFLNSGSAYVRYAKVTTCRGTKRKENVGHFVRPVC